MRKVNVVSATAQKSHLVDLRTKAGLSQTEVSRRMGVNKARVGQIERDYPSVRFDTVESYIRALGGDLCIFGIGEDDVMTRDIAPDPRGPRDHGYRRRSGADGHPRTGDQ